MSVKTNLRNGAAQLLFLMGLTAPKRRSRGRLSIVTFHRVLPAAERQAYPYPGLVVTPQELDAFLTYFTRQFDCGALATQHARFLGGEVPARPLLALTFDDAQYDNHRYARPVLARHQLRASFFVPVVAVERQELLWHDRLGFAVLALLGQPHGREWLFRVLAAAGLSGGGPRSLVENVVEASKGLALEARLRLVGMLGEVSGTAQAPDFARLMTFQELAELAADGHEIGSHSMTHCLMPECDDRALTYELAESRHVLEARLGQAIESFCYPNGNSDTRTAYAVAKAGYRRAVTTTWGYNAPEADRFQLRRCDMDARRVTHSSGNLLPALLAFRMSGFYPGLGEP
jgi:peptidoglycan/xylan/chitin deacetylase (PgdA/CDA1 family)